MVHKYPYTMDTININLLRIDAAWGFLAYNLGKEGLSKEQIEEIKTKFSKHFLNETKPIDDWMREVYQKTFLPAKEQQELIKHIHLYLKERVEELFKVTWNGEPGSDQKALAELEEEFKRQMSNLVLLNQPEVIGKYFCYIFDEKNQALADELLQQVWTGCQRGEPGFFNLMAKMLYGRNFAYVKLADKEPINDIKRSLAILHRLADLEAKNAIHTLNMAYTFNTIGEDDDEVKLNFSIKQRLAIIKRLAEAGDFNCREQWASIVYFDSIGGDKTEFSSAERKRYFQQLIEAETEFSHWITDYYFNDGDKYFEAGLSISASLTILEERARRGDRYAHEYLIETYSTGQIGDYKRERPIKIKPQDRWKRLQQLKGINVQLWTKRIAPIYMEGYLKLNEYDKGESNESDKDKWPIPVSPAERCKWLTDNIKYNLEEIGKLFSYSELPDKDWPENLRSRKARFEFCYKLALSDKEAKWAVEHIIRTIFASFFGRKGFAAELSAEERFAIAEQLALAGHSEAQFKYSELINSDPNKDTFSSKQRKKIGQVAKMARYKRTADGLVDYSGRSREENEILRRLIDYRQVLYYLARSWKLSPAS